MLPDNAHSRRIVALCALLVGTPGPPSATAVGPAMGPAMGPAVPAVPASQPERFAEDVAELRSVTGVIAEQLRAFNELYVAKLEPRVVSVAASLGGLHANVERILERARVWDALQLHAVAWADQMHSLSAKMDLLSRAQENISALEARLASLPGLDYRLEAVAARLEDADKRLELLSRSVDGLRADVLDARREGRGDREPGVVTQFAARGALSSLRVVEKKLDRLSQQLSRQHRERDGHATRGGRTRPSAQAMQALDADDGEVKQGRFVVRCHVAPAVLDILKDVSAKVDVLYDLSPGGKADLGEEDEDGNAEGGDLELGAASAISRRHKLRRHGQEECGSHATEDSPPPLSPRPSRTSSADENSPATPTTPTTDVPDDDTRTPSASTPPAATPNVGGEKAPAECGGGVARALDALTQAVRAVAAVSAMRVLPSAPPAGAEWAGCEDLVGQGRPSGEYVIRGHRVFCDMDTDGGGWTVIQRRGDWSEPRVNFSRSWADYREGFGDPAREFWIGNMWLHKLTEGAGRNVSLRVDLWDWEGERAVAEYADFSVADEEALFALSVGAYSGNASDALAAHRGRPFSTWDANHDTAPACCPCAPAYAAGWWFYSCFEANLNGEFHTHPEENEHYRGIIWEGWRGDYSLRAASMMLRGTPVARATDQG